MSNKNNILVFNCGSSSVKFTVINPDNGDVALSGIVEALNTGSPYITIKNQDKKILDKHSLDTDDYEYAIEFIIAQINNNPECADSIKAIGHRVVHGGEYFKHSVVIDQGVVAKIELCNDLAPLHNPANLEGIKTAQKEYKQLKNVACFDTAFHQTMPENSYLYPVPYSWYKEHQVRKYGFHGMSHQYVSREAVRFLKLNLDKSKVITAHLGNGCSAAAVLNGKSVDTTMGMTPLEGLMMGTRSGNIDPSIIFYISEKLDISAQDAFRLLNKQSGLLGVSELSMDMRTLEEQAAKGHKQAQIAIDLFCYILAKNIGSLMVALGGLDVLVFTGGIGENSDVIRSNTIKHLTAFNLNLDEKTNQNLARGASGNIADENSVPILVIPTNEELMIAQETIKLI